MGYFSTDSELFWWILFHLFIIALNLYQMKPMARFIFYQKFKQCQFTKYMYLIWQRVSCKDLL